MIDFIFLHNFGCPQCRVPDKGHILMRALILSTPRKCGFATYIYFTKFFTVKIGTNFKKKSKFMKSSLNLRTYHLSKNYLFLYLIMSCHYEQKRAFFFICMKILNILSERKTRLSLVAVLLLRKRTRKN